MNNLLDLVHYNSINHPFISAQIEKNSKGIYVSTSNYDLEMNVNSFSASLYSLGVKKHDLVGLISENRSSWLVSDLAVLSLGAADVPRGLDVTDIELEQILGETDVK